MKFARTSSVSVLALWVLALAAWPDAWSPAGPLNDTPGSMKAPRLAMMGDGRVMLLTYRLVQGQCELYSPLTGTWSTAASPIEPRQEFALQSLADGRVLLMSGVSVVSGVTTPTCEIFDPFTGAWSSTGSLGAIRSSYSHLIYSVLLPDGRVLGTQSGSSLCELYNPSTGLWTPAASLNSIPGGNVILLNDGRVMASSGSSCEIYNSLSDQWSVVASSPSPAGTLSAVLADGRVLAIEYNFTCQLYDPASNSWSPAASTACKRVDFVAHRLSDGRVLVAGGRGSGVLLGEIVTHTEAYNPVLDRWEPQAPMLNLHNLLYSVMLNDGRILIASLPISGLEFLEIYDPAAPAIPDIVGPPAPFGITPVGNPTLPGPNVTFDWTDMTDPSGGVTYDFQVISSANGAVVVDRPGLLASTTTESLVAGAYSWRVRARDGVGNIGSWQQYVSPPQTFTVGDAVPPGTPTLLSPANGSTISANPMAFDWSDVSDPSGVSFDFQVATSSVFDAPSLLVDRSSLVASSSLETISPGTRYWRVRAVDGVGNVGAWSATYSFSKIIGVPTLLSPANGATVTGNPVAFDWSDVTEAGVTYDFQVSKNSGFTQIIVNLTGLTSSSSSQTISKGIRYWRVRAKDAAGNTGAWSGVFWFNKK